jgi:hypothetical protein
MPVFVLRSFQRSFALYFAEVSMPDPLTQLPIFVHWVAALFAVHCVAEESAFLIL